MLQQDGNQCKNLSGQRVIHDSHVHIWPRKAGNHTTPVEDIGSSGHMIFYFNVGRAWT